MEYSASSIRSATYVGGYFALWAAVLVLLRNLQEFDASEALVAVVILGVIFPALALLATRRLVPLPYVVRQPNIETIALLGMSGRHRGAARIGIQSHCAHRD